MKNIYDEAHNLAQAIKESPEGQRFREAQDRLKASPDSERMAKDFFAKQMMVQTRQMMGQELSQEEIADFNIQATAVMGNPDVAQYIQAQMAFITIYQDVLKIVNDAAGIDMDFFGNAGA
ncbi:MULTISPECIES: YlbF family regulator [Eubacterium]|uniref:Cell fate regulator YlbF, YheA/YmcA/DUF963 family (Controls sporulation, competence, biofilm development) n=2 Tax=Eubacterium TaxID=1730 RepID=A0A1H3ZZ29_9FIRM|nr:MULTISPECIES: YlbF family regulator [Eubacterium]MDD4692011.1 YlbF family regulator [Eubacterium aggregans]MEA5074528.1 YlbF family regulator [Eubacterium aggregans]SDX60493.1 Cell fate regulator YlbF, YheA/YmcA/DUF963 family (controls sporulation, competence, biofilm development) [Eubacterium barkeri]SEA28601.1 Cell fate regulator YlbF, YheA/YmcA/DUF963 family (controls sporulation, competence, biofilm development) [Eubacterium aggregans]